jgi:RNA polymerase sigma-70 factor (ECF subfamily)
MRRTSDEREEERILLEGLLAGDERAWRAFRRYDRLIYRCIRKVTQRFPGSVSNEDEHEIYGMLLEQLLRDHRKLRAYDPARGARFGTWLGLLARHVAYDFLRSSKRASLHVPLSELEVDTRSESPFEAAERRQRSQRMRALTAQLTESDRRFVALYFERGLDPEEVARLLRISIKTVYSKKHKIRARLEELAGARIAAA